MNKILFLVSLLFLLSNYSVKAQNNSNEPVLTNAQKKDSSNVVNPDQEINTKIPRISNCSQTRTINNSSDNIPNAIVMEKKIKPGKIVEKKK